MNDLDILDKSLDDIEDLPGFGVPPAGHYTLKMNAAVKEVNNKSCVELSYEVLGCLEKNDPDAKDAKIGSKFSSLYFLENETALSSLKEILVPIGESSGQRNLKILITEVCKDLVVAAKVKQQKDKKDPEKVYARVSDITVA